MSTRLADEPKLTLKQRKWLSAYIETGNATDACRQAGYAGEEETLASIGYENLRKLQVPVGHLMDRMGLDDGALLRKLKEGLDAEMVRIASFEGAITDERTYIDYPTRHHYLETALKLKGKFPTQKMLAEITGRGGGPILIREIVIERPSAAEEDS